MKKIAKSIPLLLGVFLLCVVSSISAQVLETPIVVNNEGSACDLTGTTDFPLAISFTTTTFNDDNEFIIELSDKNGSFDNASDVIELRKLISTAADNYNAAFNINTSFQLPSGVFGTNYKIRVRATSPEMESISAPFEAYYDMFAEGELEINNNNNFTLCGDETKEVSLNTDIVGEYLWFRRVGGTDTEVGRTQEPKFTIAQSGLYYVVIDYGACGGPKSKFINVTGISDADAAIKGNSVVEICGDESHTFEAEVNDNTYLYKWFKDGELKQSLNSNTYTTPTTGQLGKYHLEIEVGGCTAKSEEVELKQKNTANFTVTNEGVLKAVLLPGETRELSITHTASSSATITWYDQNDDQLLGKSGPVINVSIPGEYYARVTEPPTASGDCAIVVDSERFVLLGVESFNVEIRTDTDYNECSSSEATLSIIGVEARGEDGNDYTLSDEQIALLEYQWYKTTDAITGEVNEELVIDSYDKNGLYSLFVTVRNLVSGRSEEIEVKLIAFPEITSPSVSNSLCPGGTIIYTIDALLTGYKYEWFKDDDPTPVATDVKDFEVIEVGSYVLKISGFGCEVNLEAIEVVLFDESVVTVTPSEKVVLTLGQTVTVTAAGADSYVWREGEKDPSGRELSTNETLTVNSLGFYTVYATVGTCTIERVVEVVEQDDLVIVPNVVTPNGDGKNDTWKISNRYAFQPSVTVIIYNSEGKELVNLTDYKNDWPLEDIKNQRVFYYRIIRDDKTLKAGTISVLH